MSFFGLHIRSATPLSTPQTPWFQLGQTCVRMWDTGTRWHTLEPSKGEWNFSTIDQYAALAVANGCSILFTLGQPPAWATGGVATGNYNASPPTNDADWVDYLQALVPRFPPGTAWEIWNEPEQVPYYSDTVERLAELQAIAWQTIKAIDPSAMIVSGGVSHALGYLDGYLPLVAEVTDVVGIHGYHSGEEPEAITQRLRWARSMARRYGLGECPIWDTEYTCHAFRLPNGTFVSGPSSSAITLASDPLCMPQSQAAAYMAREFIVRMEGGADRVFFYGLDYWWSGLRLLTNLAIPNTLTEAAAAYEHAVSMLDGARVFRLRQVPPLYSADWSGPRGRGRIFWCKDSGTAIVDLSQYRSAFDVLGNPVAISAATEVGLSPIYCLA